ncbi:MAG: hypothetical protein KC416_16750, partial [Myxococcales bacterium]|nr:hypothetical protein [Myxococcales bacterium]
LGVVGADPVRRHPERRAARFQEMAKNGLGRPVAFRFEPSVPGSWAGAPIVDRTGMLVGTVLTPGSSAGAVSWGQPLARVPQDWWTDLDGGHLRFRTVEGIRPIPPDETVHDVLVWNHDASHHLFQIEDDASGSVSVDPDLPLSLWVGAKRVARGTGLLAAIEGGRGRRVAVRVSDGEGDPVAYSIRFVPTDSAVPNASSNDRKPAPLPDADGPFYVPERFRKDPGTTSKGTASVWGYVLDAVTGRPVRSATVVVGKPGVRLEGHVEDYLNGRMSERTFRTKVEAMVHTDVRGMYRVLKLAKGKRYPLVILARGYRPRVFQVSLDEVRSIYELRAVSLIR